MNHPQNDDDFLDLLGDAIRASEARRFDPKANPKIDARWVKLASRCTAVLELESPNPGIPELEFETLEELQDGYDDHLRLGLAFELLALFEAKDTEGLERIIRRLKAIKKAPMPPRTNDVMVAFTHAAEAAAKRGKPIREATKRDFGTALGRFSISEDAIPTSEDGRTKWFQRMSLDWMKQKRRDE